MKEYKWHEAIELAITNDMVFVDSMGNRLEWYLDNIVIFPFGSNVCTVKRITKEFIETKFYDIHEWVKWSKVAVDTKILCRDNHTQSWYKYHFAKFKNGKIYAWIDGKTSFTVDEDYDFTEFKQAKLYKEDEPND